MGSQVILTALFRLGGAGLRQVGYRAADIHRDQLCHKLTSQAAFRRNFSARYSSLRKDDAVDSKLESHTSKKPLIEPDDETRSILNDIWRDFECVPTKPSPAEGGSGGPPAPAAGPKGDVSEKSADGPRITSLLRSARASAKKLFAEEDSSIILDSAEEQSELFSAIPDVDYIPQSIKVDPFEGLNLKRGETGVFEVEELVEILREEKLTDIAVISVPEEMAYADYLVLATAVSPRQARGVTEFLQRLYKRKKDSTDPTLFIEGENTADWKVLDMGNVVLHVFLPETRRHYDVETLWTVGSDYDDLTHAKDDPVYNVLQQQIQLLQEMQPGGSNSRCALQS